MPLSKPGQILLRRSVELRNKFLNPEGVAGIWALGEPAVRKALYWLLLICLTVEEHLLQILMEEG